MKCRLDSHIHSRQPLPELTERLRRSERKITGARKAILEVLREHPHPMTNKEVFQALPKGRCDLATVYRSIHLLLKMNMVQRFDFGDGTARFELSGEGAHSHHHHLVCNQCSAVVELEECFPEELEQKIAERNDFSGVSHKLEFFGTCPDCQ